MAGRYTAPFPTSTEADITEGLPISSPVSQGRRPPARQACGVAGGPEPIYEQVAVEIKPTSRC